MSATDLIMELARIRNIAPTGRAGASSCGPELLRYSRRLCRTASYRFRITAVGGNARGFGRLRWTGSDGASATTTMPVYEYDQAGLVDHIVSL